MNFSFFSNRCSFLLKQTKRNAFPRFYFLSNDDLLEFLGQSTKDHIIQKHIKKLFPGVHELGCSTNSSGTSHVISVSSAEGEQIKLSKAIEITGPIENWLNALLLEIKATMKALVVKCATHEKLNEELIVEYPAQVLFLSRAIQFTKMTEKAIGASSLPKHLQALRDEMDYFTTKFAGADNLTQIKVRGLLLDLVHYVSMVQQLINENIAHVQDWEWSQQMRFYINSNGLVTIRMVYAEFEYSYEYLGNFNKLVDTKLTHNCYLTLTQAMQLGLGGNPFGPAGTGKTECVKSLGAMLGRLVLVFNCNEVRSLDDIFETMFILSTFPRMLTPKR